MRRTVLVSIAVVLIVGTMAAVPASASSADVTPTDDAATATPTPTPAADEATETATAAPADGSTDTSNVSPGARLSGVLGVQDAELTGELESRAFEIAVARARTDESKAAVVARQVRGSDERLAELAARQERLRAARENGSIDEDRYRAQVARLEAETETVERLATRSEAETADLPTDVLERAGVNVTAIRTLRTTASDLTGQEVSAIARSIAGPEVGQRLGTDGAGSTEHDAPTNGTGVAERAPRVGAGNETREADDGRERGPPDEATTAEPDGTGAPGDGSTDEARATNDETSVTETETPDDTTVEGSPTDDDRGTDGDSADAGHGDGRDDGRGSAPGGR